MLQDVGLRSVSMGLMVLRRCWGNLAVLDPCLCCGSCSSAREASGHTKHVPAAWRGAGGWLGTGCARAVWKVSGPPWEEAGGRGSVGGQNCKDKPAAGSLLPSSAEEKPEASVQRGAR